ncbi:protein DGCR6-like isoform X2 [Gordionus sp. m RMFG-2023]
MQEDILPHLIKSLFNGTVCEIVKGLLDIQHLTEKNLYNQRIKLITAHKEQKQLMELKQKKKSSEFLANNRSDSSNMRLAQSQEIEIMENRQKEELRKLDMRIIMELDQKVMDQQVTLEKAGVPTFHVTNNPNEIQMQIYILGFIKKIGSIVFHQY